MKKLLVLGFVLTLFSAAVSAQQATDGSFRRHRTEEGYQNGERHHPEMRGSHRHQRHYRMERRSRHERHRFHRMHRHERRHMHRTRHNHHRRSI